MPSGRKTTIEEIIFIIESKGCKLLTVKNKINAKDDIEILCPCGNPYNTNLDRFIRGNQTVCGKCSKERVADALRSSLDDVISKIEIAGYFYVEGEYKNRTERNLIITDSSGYYYLCSMTEIGGAIKNGGSLEYVSKSNPYTIQNIRRWLVIFDKTFKLVSETYTMANDSNLFFLCSICDETWDTKWAGISRGQGCPYCSGRRVGKSNSFGTLYSELLKEWDYDRNSISPFEITVNTHIRVWWKCSYCKNRWKTRPCKRAIEHTGCPKCASSYGEDKIYDILVKNKIRFKHQEWFEDCPRLSQRPLSFDFYLYDYNLVIEFNGIQHYEPVEFFGGEKAFREQKKRDKIKVKYCKDNNIPLLIIPYWKFDNIEEILANELGID